MMDKRIEGIRTVGELIKQLGKYPVDTEVVGGSVIGRGTSIADLILLETNPLGERDSEDDLLLMLGYEEE